jgi:glyoxylase-like metal-dependent hydrolase (beta-lactamase superfamily II)
MRDDIAMTTGNSQDSGSPDITDLGNDVYQIDTRMAGYQGITAGYLIRSSRPCLVETGTSTSAPVVRAALASLGIGASDLATVVVTHIHLDHAGGVGDIASMFGAAQVVVHEEGARHLADPSRLMAGARSLAPEADPEVAEKFERLLGAAANVSGIWHWLGKLEQPAA